MRPAQRAKSGAAGPLLVFILGVSVGIAGGWALLQSGWRLQPMGYDELSTLVKTLAWPVIVIGVVTMFRTQIAKKIEDLESVTFPGGGGKWSTELEDTQALVKFGGEEQGRND